MTVGRSLVDLPSETWYWIGAAAFIVGLDEATIPNADYATQDVWLGEGHTWMSFSYPWVRCTDHRGQANCAQREVLLAMCQMIQKLD